VPAEVRRRHALPTIFSTIAGTKEPFRYYFCPAVDHRIMNGALKGREWATPDRIVCFDMSLPSGPDSVLCPKWAVVRFE
jgi:hypothetical protein